MVLEIRRLGLALLAVVLALGAAGAPAASAAGDPLMRQQWVFKKSDPVGAIEAWTRSKGDGVTVAVIDSGVQLDHPDLAANIWRNPDEIANGLDDDANGIVDDLHGANLVSNDGAVDDDGGHGTRVAGIIAMRGRNGVGGSGIAPNARIMAVKVSSAAAGANVQLLARGIRYAVGEGARIISVSLNGEQSTLELDDAVRFAEAAGATIVASAGNNARNIDRQPSFPVSLPNANVLGATATLESGEIMSAANYGRGAVDIAAPGAMVLSTSRGSGYALCAGTSMAAPLVAGALALLAAARPDLSQATLRDTLLATARRSSDVAGKVAAGSLDVSAAMHRLLPGGWSRSGARARTRLRLRAARRARTGRRVTVRWSATNARAVKRWRVSLNGRRVRTLSARQARRVKTRVTRTGTNRWTVTGYDAKSKRVVSSSRTFRAVRRR